MRALLTGAGGMLGSSILQAWRRARPDDEIIGLRRSDVDLTDRRETRRVIDEAAPDVVIHAAAQVGGIAAKRAHPTRYLLDNLLIDTSVITASLESGVGDLLYIASAAAYPEDAAQPVTESALGAGRLEAANEGYGMAKLAGLKLCEYGSAEFGVSYRAVLPSNLYGPGDDFSSENGHLIAAVLGRLDEAHRRGDATVSIWGDGQSRREFTFAGDLAAWLVDQADRLDAWPVAVNAGFGVDFPITHFYDVARDIVGYRGEFEFDLDKPNGARRRLLDSSVARSLGWNPTTGLEQGMAASYASYLSQRSKDVTP